MWYMYVHASRKYLFLLNNTVTKYTCVLNCAMGSLKYRYLVLEGIAIKVLNCNCIRFDCVFYLLFLLKSSSCIIKYNAKCRHICIMMGTVHIEKKTRLNPNPSLHAKKSVFVKYTVTLLKYHVYSNTILYTSVFR